MSEAPKDSPLRTQMWIVPAGSEVLAKDSSGALICASTDGVEPALDLTGFVVPGSLDFGQPT